MVPKRNFLIRAGSGARLFHPEYADVELGLPPRDLEAGFAGKQYVRLCGPGSSTHQTGIY